MIVRKDILSHKGFTFTGSFSAQCQQDSLPSSLKALVSMILNGSNLKNRSKNDSQATLTIGQTIVFNTKKRTSHSADKPRHTLEREPPLPIYIGMNVHALSRSKTLIQQLFHMGICISYDRVMEIEDWIATSSCERFREDGVVAPACLRKGLFTVGALDNLDHNPSSTTSQSSFHWTGISLFQLPTKTEAGVNRPPITIPPSGNAKHSLPDSYAFVPAVALKTTAVAVPECSVSEVTSCLDEAIAQERRWIEDALSHLETELTCGDAIAWATYHASIQPPVEDPPALHALLPLFYEKSATPAMIKHGIDVLRQAVEFLNPGQIPVTTFDQPLFALAKCIQWKWPDTHAHLTRTRHAQQTTLLTLHNLQKEAFLLSEGSKDFVCFNAWKNDMQKKSPTFMYWDLVMIYETLILIFIRAHREKNFPLYVQILEELVPLFFALDHQNYAQWMPVHIRDMKSLPVSIKEEFVKCSHWVLAKTTNKFSAMPFDQAHEQENKIVKSSGGIVGLTENPVALRRWVLSGPEISRLLKQFEEEYHPDDDPESLEEFHHHEQDPATQKTFQRQVTNLSETIRRICNPFLDDFPDLISLDNRNCTDGSAIVSLHTLEERGKKQYEEFVKNVLDERSHSIHDPIKRNSVKLFRKHQYKVTSKQGKKIKVLQNNVELFGQLYISIQNREGDLAEVFAHEIQSFPPSLSDFGKLHLANKNSDLLQCIEQPGKSETPSVYDCKLLDGVVIVHCLPVTSVNTFHEYADTVFIPYT
ncbi:hypothetical protein Pcinc_006754 [Petrolisthes cinctipes]|uniref:Uncharacterized protein n=1 Tax=Petrolisthes cinctipes TaxID=88211 RepID=A0AAE1GAS5_PETCI|nr:hypothetical protein Pcinc_006754 [Petrolisthes cinctipes]